MHSSRTLCLVLVLLTAGLGVNGCGEEPLAPAIDGVNPPSQQVDRMITIWGRNLGAAGSRRSLSIGGATAPAITAWNDNQIVAAVPRNLEGSVPIVVTVDGRTSKPFALTVTLPDPTLGSIEPNPAMAGETIRLKGLNFGASRGRVLLGEAGEASIQTWAADRIVARLPKGIVQVSVKVLRGDRPSNALVLDIVRPIVYSITPRRVVPGRTITIKGTQFGGTRGTGRVTFDGVEATAYRSWKELRIECVAPVPASEAKKAKVVVHALDSSSEPWEYDPAGMPANGPVTEAGDRSGPCNQIRLDPEGLPLLFFHSNTYAQPGLLLWDGFSWAKETWEAPWLYDGSFRKNFGIALDVASDAPGEYFMVCLNGFDQSVILCRRKAGKWSMETILPPPKVDSWRSLAIGLTREGAPIGFHYQKEIGVTTFWKDKDAWREQVIDPAGGDGQDAAQISLAQGTAGELHLAWLSPGAGQLRHATNAGGTWRIGVVDSGNVGGWPSIARGPGGQIAISYCDLARKHLKVARLAVDRWVTETVDAGKSTGRWTSLAIDARGKLHVAYCDEANPGIRYATDSAGSWKIVSPVATRHVADHTSIVLDRRGKALICWHNDDKQRLELWREP